LREPTEFTASNGQAESIPVERIDVPQTKGGESLLKHRC